MKFWRKKMDRDDYVALQLVANLDVIQASTAAGNKTVPEPESIKKLREELLKRGILKAI